MGTKHVLIFSLCLTTCGFVSSLHRDFLVEENKKTLLNLYSDFLREQPRDVESFETMRKHFDKLIKIIPYLDINLSLKKIKRKYFKNGFLQLREIDLSLKTLVIGCGNHPISMRGWQEIFIHPDYYNDHAHDDAITIDPNLKQNPTIVGYFGTAPIDVLPDHHFEKIIIEDIDIPYLLNLSHTKSEIIRLLKPGGRLYYDLKEISRKADSVDDLLTMWHHDHDGDEVPTEKGFIGFLKQTWRNIVTKVKNFFG